MTTEYALALDAMHKAEAIFQKATADYRACRIGDTEYLVARSVHAKAEKAFDVAFSIEANR